MKFADHPTQMIHPKNHDELADKRLWAHVLARAIRDLDVKTRRPWAEARECDEAWAWFRQESLFGRVYAGSFPYVCNVLGFNPRIVLSQLEATEDYAALAERVAAWTYASTQGRLF